MISLDTECTGLDIYHGAQPFYVTIAHEDGKVEAWEWDVDPLTRKVEIPEEDVKDIRVSLCFGDDVVTQNGKFDCSALAQAKVILNWPWNRIYDTLLAGHLLGTNLPHDLTSMAMQYLGVDIEPFELRLKQACNEARRLARSKFPTWRIAKKGLPEMPSAKGEAKEKKGRGVEGSSPWKLDTWLPRAIALELTYPEGHPWWTVLSEYSNTDSAVTLALWKVQRAKLERCGLWEIYLVRLKLLPIAYEMERRGVTVSGQRLEELARQYSETTESFGSICTNIAEGYSYDLRLPKGGRNKSLNEFVFDVMKLEKIYDPKGKSDGPMLDSKVAIPEYLATLPPRSKQYAFVQSLANRRSSSTAVTYLEGYKRHWLPNCQAEWFTLHPSVNPTGTDHLRWSGSNPNPQNISKREGFNLRYCFGPAPGREWWSLDAKNLELRIPSYESGEKDLIAVFDKSNDPPYFGSYHLLIFDLLHPAEFKRYGPKCKSIYESTLYQWVKNGNFALIYGAQKETADRAYRVAGAYEKIRYRFPKIIELNDRMKAYADKHGYVETIPDRLVNPERGYPILCTRSEHGRVMPTLPLNYHVSGTAMWWMACAQVECFAKLKEWNAEGFDGFITLQVHDEIVIDLPARNPFGPGKRMIPGAGNINKIHELRELMERCGDRIGVPTPVEVEYHSENWSEGAKI